MEFKDISDEEFREYVFPQGEVIRVVGVKLNVSASGGHRLVDAQGQSHYIPPRWIQLRWVVKEGRPNFAF